ncbi:hypothetical protein SODALDRAFT_360709 [Sodiomyces alkalinus F11]|uniref:Uncharacterized protein n=1 Tax=Sodiomyces alkalinus (strain CBS 110278 / VKM F-3762 / F11) TaxID=1314773 RepID=A0A3N2PV10_SODAK|nr:hypothetical protein SODALDRAFT_360709 [Sodiomyces alkalinus F11]ROT38343.1 hypothetical protein SODALDRAFT_360709 [Sodiomyces alkalinus F11]
MNVTADTWHPDGLARGLKPKSMMIACGYMCLDGVATSYQQPADAKSRPTTRDVRVTPGTLLGCFPTRILFRPQFSLPNTFPGIRLSALRIAPKICLYIFPCSPPWKYLVWPAGPSSSSTVISMVHTGNHQFWLRDGVDWAFACELRTGYERQENSITSSGKTHIDVGERTEEIKGQPDDRAYVT